MQLHNFVLHPSAVAVVVSGTGWWVRCNVNGRTDKKREENCCWVRSAGISFIACVQMRKVSMGGG